MFSHSVEQRDQTHDHQHHAQYHAHALPHDLQRFQKQFTLHALLLLSDQRDDQAAGDDRGDLPGHVGARRRASAGSCCGSSFRPILCTTRADIGKAEMPAAPTMGLIFFLQEQVEQLGKQHAADGVEHEGHQAQPQDQQRLAACRKYSACISDGDGQAQQQRDQVGQHLLRGLGQRFPARRIRGSGCRTSGSRPAPPMRGADQTPAMTVTRMGKRIAWSLGDVRRRCRSCGCRRSFFVVTSRMTGGLHDGHQRHVRIRRHDDGADVFGCRSSWPRRWRSGRRPRR